MAHGQWRMEAGAGCWKLEAGSWKLEAGSWKLEVQSAAQLQRSNRCSREQIAGFMQQGADCRLRMPIDTYKLVSFYCLVLVILSPVTS